MNITKINANETIESFKPRQPDWKQLYYALAMRVVSAQTALALGDKKTASESLEKATKVIAMNESAIEIGNSMVIVKTSKSEVA